MRKKFTKVYMITLFVLFLSCFAIKFFMEYQSTYQLTTLEGDIQALDNIEIRAARAYTGYQSEFVIADGDIDIENVDTDNRYGIEQETIPWVYGDYVVCISDQGNLEYEISPTTDPEITGVYTDSSIELYNVDIHGDAMTLFLKVVIGQKQWVIDTEIEEPIEMGSSYYRSTFSRDPFLTEVETETQTYQNPYENTNWNKAQIANVGSIRAVEIEYQGDTAYVFPLYQSYQTTGGIYRIDISDVEMDAEWGASPFFDTWGSDIDIFYEDLEDVVYKEKYEAEGEYEKINTIDLAGKTFYDMSLWKDYILLTYSLDGELYIEQYDTDGQLKHTLHMPNPREEGNIDYWEYGWIKGETTSILVVSRIENDYNKVQYYNVVVDEEFNKLHEVEGIGECINYAEIVGNRYVEITSSTEVVPIYPSFVQQGYVDAREQKYYIQVYEKTEGGVGDLTYKGELDFQFSDASVYGTIADALGEYGAYAYHTSDWEIQEVNHD